ncbi:MAG: 2-amino-3,7-dideoxy-D-threo-hept-6-ulosonate synthase [bacterium]|nr:2-amino-3,7-dideoxy-D-threo-hept-6-ulosonate synthase [bacterium]
MIGKEIRLERIMNRNTNRTIIVPMDHGVTVGPIEGLVDMKKAINSIVEGGTNAIILHKGIVKSGHRRGGKDVGLIIHLSASTALGTDPNAKVDICTVEEAIQFGADAVSIHVNLGAETEGAMLRHFGLVSKECTHWGMPLLAMMYTRGKKIQNEYDVKVVKHAARVGAELGADLVKVNYTGNPESFHEVIQGCPVPVIIAGGEKMETDKEVLEMVEGAIKSGGCGVSFGRNVFQHADPSEILKKIARIVHNP